MQKKKPFVLRLHPEMMEALEKWAADEFRSVNGQIEYLLHRALAEKGRLKNSKGAQGTDPTLKKEKNDTGTEGKTIHA